jgi:polyisoprenoid-binding protein YceI
MRSRLVVISEVLAKNAAKVSLAKHDGVVETFPANRANEPLDVTVLPKRTGRGQNGFDTETLDHSSKNYAVERISISKQVLRS